MKKNIILILIIFSSIGTFSQELNCSVQVVSDKIPGSDKRIYETLKIAIVEFMNNRKWTKNIFRPEERIECSMLVNLTSRDNDQFAGTIQLQLRRPVFKTSYNTVLLNFIDKDITFKYVESQPLDYTDNSFISNLTSILAYYAYVMVGMDYDSFSLYGGTTYYEKAQLIISSAQSQTDKGWKSFDGTKNRYWIIENLLNQSCAPFRESLYKYHRLGLDVMSDKVETGRQTITSCIEQLKKLNRDKPNLFILNLFFTAKVDELVNIYSGSNQVEKGEVVPMLNEVDPGNSTKYKNINTAK